MMPLSLASDSKRARQLTRADWLQAALDVLVERGIDGVQITRLARQLSVTRGSFYWHFDSREALLSALISEWRARNTGVMVEALAGSETLESGLLELFAVWVDHNRFDPRLDQALRDWGRRDTAVADAVADEDTARVAAIATFYERMDFTPTDAFIRARVIYFTQVSYYALGVSEPLARRASFLSAYFRTFTGREIDAGAAARFLKRMGEEA